MKAIRTITIILTISGLISTGLAIDNPNIGRGLDSPVGSGRSPVSEGQRGLHRSPSPFSSDGNQIVTGQVGGGRHFRGAVPYGSQTEFGGTLATSPIEGFMRYSGTRTQDFGFEPHYSSRGTVTQTSPVGPGVVTGPSASRIDDRRQIPDAGVAGDDIFFSPGDELFSRRRPLERSLADIELSRLDSPEYFPGGQPELEQIGVRDMDIDDEELADLTEQLRRRRRPELDFDEEDPEADVELPEGFEGMRREDIDIEDMDIDIEGKPWMEHPEMDMDVYQQMMLQIERFREEAVEEDTYEEQPDDEEAEAPEQIGPMTEQELVAARARGEMDEYKTFATFAGGRFDRHMRDAERFLKAGEFYNAADSYKLASIYKPENPLAYAGRSHALFAAGEYLSSAFMLGRAIEMFEGYAALSIDIVAMIGDRDLLESRMATARRLSEQTEAGEFDFLLAYYYHHLGRSDRAGESIRQAADRLSDWRAVEVLKVVIEG